MFRKRHPQMGASPGTLSIHSDSPMPFVHVIDYSPEELHEHDVQRIADLKPFVESPSMCWIDVQGFGDEKILREIGNLIDLHPLALADAINVPQRPKVETYGKHLLWITQMVMPQAGHRIRTEQVSLVLGPNYLITFQERYGDVLDPVRERIRAGKGLMRKSGPDYLAYAVIDAVIDGYYPIMEDFGEHLEELEDEIVARPHPELLQQIHRVKREMLALRRAVWPQREAINQLIRDDSDFVCDSVKTYLRDVYDHCIQIIDVIETYRELVSGLMDVYLSSVANRQNEVMKVLTITATIFIPLTFLAGIYGMNFDDMPELHEWWAYPVVLVLMGLISLGMLYYFRRKGWLGRADAGDENADAD